MLGPIDCILSDKIMLRIRSLTSPFKIIVININAIIGVQIKPYNGEI